MHKEPQDLQPAPAAWESLAIIPRDSPITTATAAPRVRKAARLGKWRHLESWAISSKPAQYPVSCPARYSCPVLPKRRPVCSLFPSRFEEGYRSPLPATSTALPRFQVGCSLASPEISPRPRDRPPLSLANHRPVRADARLIPIAARRCYNSEAPAPCCHKYRILYFSVPFSIVPSPL